MMLYFLAIILPTPPAFRRCITAISYTTRSQREQRTGRCAGGEPAGAASTRYGGR